MFDYLWILQKFGGMGDAMDDIDESDDEGMCDDMMQIRKSSIGGSTQDGNILK